VTYTLLIFKTIYPYLYFSLLFRLCTSMQWLA